MHNGNGNKVAGVEESGGNSNNEGDGGSGKSDGDGIREGIDDSNEEGNGDRLLSPSPLPSLSPSPSLMPPLPSPSLSHADKCNSNGLVFILCGTALYRTVPKIIF
jgi:hypothetical protein